MRLIEKQLRQRFVRAVQRAAGCRCDLQRFALNIDKQRATRSTRKSNYSADFLFINYIRVFYYTYEYLIAVSIYSALASWGSI